MLAVNGQTQCVENLSMKASTLNAVNYLHFVITLKNLDNTYHLDIPQYLAVINQFVQLNTACLFASYIYITAHLHQTY